MQRYVRLCRAPWLTEPHPRFSVHASSPQLKDNRDESPGWWRLSAFVCGHEHIGQVVAWGRAHGPFSVAGAGALARANLGSFAARHRVDMVPDWESKLARKFGGYEDGEEYVRLCIEESRRRCTLSAASIANMCMCLAFQSRHLPEWEDSLAKLFLDRVTAAAIVAARPDPGAVEWLYEVRADRRRDPGPC